MQIDKKMVGEKINEIRKKNGYSMEQFGKQIGDAPRGSVNSWEKGVNLPNKERLELIAIMGNTTVDELLYGSLNDYVNNLITNNLGVKISYHFIDPFVENLKAQGFTYGDDVEILRFVKGFFNANNVVTSRPSVFYKPISEQENLFIGNMDVNMVIKPYYYAYSDIEKDTLHVTPYAMNEESSNLYSYPPKLTESGEHDYFTSGLIPLKLTIRNFHMIYYGLDIVDMSVQISKFDYDAKSDALVLYEGELDSTELYSPFVKSIEKELLYLKYVIQK